MALPVIQDAVHNDVRHIPGDDVPEHALQIVNSPDFLTVTFSNAREPGKAAEAATPTDGARSRLVRFAQFARCDPLEHFKLGELVLKLVFWNLYARTTVTLPATQGAPPMVSAQDLQRELATVLSSYFKGETSMSEYLTWEVEFTTSDDAQVDPDLSSNAGGLALLGHEYLMDIRPQSDFDEEARRLLTELQPTGPASEAAGS